MEMIALCLSLPAVSCISKKVPEPAANKEEIEGEKAESAARFYLFLLGHAPHPHP